MLVEPFHQNGGRAGAAQLGHRAGDDFGRPLLPGRQAGIDGVEVDAAGREKLAQPPRLQLAQRRELVVILGEERRLTVTDQVQQTHNDFLGTAIQAWCSGATGGSFGPPVPSVSHSHWGARAPASGTQRVKLGCPPFLPDPTRRFMACGKPQRLRKTRLALTNRLNCSDRYGR